VSDNQHENLQWKFNMIQSSKCSDGFDVNRVHLLNFGHCGTISFNLLVLVVATAIIITGFSTVYGENQLKNVSLMPQWIPQAQFAGYMVAKEKGFYRDAGLDLNLLVGGPGKNGFCSLADGEATFCTGWLSTAIKKRASGVRLVNISQITQRSALFLVALKKSGIREPKDLNGKRVGYWVGEFQVPVQAFIKKHDLQVEMIPNYTTVTILLKNAVDAVAAMWYNEYHTLLNSGYNRDELNELRVGELGVDFPEDGLYCMEDSFNADPQMCAALVSASLQGWRYAFDHQDEAINIVMKYAKGANTGTNRAHQTWMLRRMKDLILPGEKHADMGKLKREDYLKVGEALVSLDMVKHLPTFEEFYRGN
jgi:NitT/TauT family transport system substrate-binding protein